MPRRWGPVRRGQCACSADGGGSSEGCVELIGCDPTGMTRKVKRPAGGDRQAAQALVMQRRSAQCGGWVDWALMRTTDQDLRLVSCRMSLPSKGGVLGFCIAAASRSMRAGGREQVLVADTMGCLCCGDYEWHGNCGAGPLRVSPHCIVTRALGRLVTELGTEVCGGISSVCW